MGSQSYAVPTTMAFSLPFLYRLESTLGDGTVKLNLENHLLILMKTFQSVKQDSS